MTFYMERDVGLNKHIRFYVTFMSKLNNSHILILSDNVIIVNNIIFK